MRGATIWVGLAGVAVAVAAVVFVVFGLGDERWAGTSPSLPTSAPPQASAAVGGWRWESYGGIEVQVPDDWGYGTTGWPPCLEQPMRPYVGRPGMVPLVGCSQTLPSPDKRVAYLWFDTHAETGVRDVDGGWAAETRVVGGVSVTVFAADAGLRAKILNSARPGPADGCPGEHKVTTGPEVRPDALPGGLRAVGPVTSVGVCRYALRDRPTPGRVLSTSQLTGEAAQGLVAAILAAPEGGGPDDPGNCAPEVRYGDEILLLVVRGSRATQEEVFVRYSGCDGHGIDDGDIRRKLTAETLRPLLTGPHQPMTLSASVGELVWPR